MAGQSAVKADQRRSRCSRDDTANQSSILKNCMIFSSRRKLRTAGTWMRKTCVLPSWPMIVMRRGAASRARSMSKREEKRWILIKC